LDDVAKNSTKISKKRTKDSPKATKNKKINIVTLTLLH